MECATSSNIQSNQTSTKQIIQQCPQASSFTELNHQQVERLRSVLKQNVEIHGRENFPTLTISLHKLILRVRRKLLEAGLELQHVKMNGGAASYVLATADDYTYSDLDLIFPISLKNERDFDNVRSAVFAALLEIMPDDTNKAMISADTLKDIYISKMIKVSDTDRWSLFSLHNDFGRCIELKFVDKMRRAFEFSVDSFQITLDRLLDNLNESKAAIKAESKYGNFSQALAHLNWRLIDTQNPEEIRGGGLLKYCHLLTRGYHPTKNCRDMEKYMCSRFFIDFPDINTQELKLLGYLDNHFGNEYQAKLDYLQILYYVCKESTVCLMGHERRQTLSMVDRLRTHLSYNVYYASNAAAYNQPFRQQTVHYAYKTPQLTQDNQSTTTTNSNSSQVDVDFNEHQQFPRKTLLFLPADSCQWIPVV